MAIIYAAGTIPGGTSYEAGAYSKRSHVRRSCNLQTAIRGEVRQTRLQLYVRTSTSTTSLTYCGMRVRGTYVQLASESGWVNTDVRCFDGLAEYVFRHLDDGSIDVIMNGSPYLSYSPWIDSEMELVVMGGNYGYVSELMFSDSLDDFLVGSVVADAVVVESGSTGTWSGGATELQDSVGTTNAISAGPQSSKTLTVSPLALPAGVSTNGKFIVGISYTMQANGNINLSVEGVPPPRLPDLRARRFKA